MRTRKSHLLTAALGVLLFATYASSLQAQEKFDMDETVIVKKTPHSKAPPKGSTMLYLKRGEIRPVFVFKHGFGKAREAFYVPREGTGTAQVIVEEKSGQTNYYIKGISRGRTVGGVVMREWLDGSGFFPANLATESRIQAELNSQPVFIEVR